MQLVAGEYLVIAEAGDANNAAPPVLQGQLFHYEGSPNRYGLPAFYGLHVWAWKDNPSGMFSSWNPRVSCESYDPPDRTSVVSGKSVSVRLDLGGRRMRKKKITIIKINTKRQIKH